MENKRWISSQHSVHSAQWLQSNSSLRVAATQANTHRISHTSARGRRCWQYKSDPRARSNIETVRPWRHYFLPLCLDQSLNTGEERDGIIVNYPALHRDSPDHDDHPSNHVLRPDSARSHGDNSVIMLPNVTSQDSHHQWVTSSSPEHRKLPGLDSGTTSRVAMMIHLGIKCEGNQKPAMNLPLCQYSQCYQFSPIPPRHPLLS